MVLLVAGCLAKLSAPQRNLFTEQFPLAHFCLKHDSPLLLKNGLHRASEIPRHEHPSASCLVSAPPPEDTGTSCLCPALIMAADRQCSLVLVQCLHRCRAEGENQSLRRGPGVGDGGAMARGWQPLTSLLSLHKALHMTFTMYHLWPAHLSPCMKTCSS